MKDFLEKWNNDSRFQTKTKLSLYTLFVVLVAIFAISSRNNIETNESNNQELTQNNNSQNNQEQTTNNNNQEVQNENNQLIKIEIPDEYDYKINITINELNYSYNGNKNFVREKITKIKDNISTNYIYENDKYYKEKDTENYLLTTKEEVYDIIDYNYLNLETINEYLSKSTKIDNQYIVYLKDIILGNNSSEYITINIENNNIIVDYTKLLNYFDKSINKYLVEINIDEKE